MRLQSYRWAEIKICYFSIVYFVFSHTVLYGNGSTLRLLVIVRSMHLLTNANWHIKQLLCVVFKDTQVLVHDILVEKLILVIIVSRGTNDRDATPISRCHRVVQRFHPRRFRLVVLMPIHLKFVEATSTSIDIQSLSHKMQLMRLILIYGLLFNTHEI